MGKGGEILQTGEGGAGAAEYKGNYIWWQE